MKILVIAAGPFPFARGTPVRALRVSEALAARGHEIRVAAFPLADRNIETSLRIERSRGARGYDKTSPGPSIAKLFVMSPRLATKVQELLKREPFDVIYAHHYEGLLAGSMARRRAGVRTPIIFDSHTLLGSELSCYFPKIFSGRIDWVGALLDRHLFRLADAVIGVTDRITSLYASHAKPGLPIVTATNGVEYEKFIRLSASVDSEPVRAVFAGNFSSYQNFDFLLAAHRKIRRQRQDIELVIAAPEADAVLGAMGVDNPGAEGILVRSGGFGELPSILAAADIATNPRTACAGIPQKLLNYMAAALPTVSFAGSAAILTHETTGLIVPNGDIDEFSGAIMRLADAPELRRRLGDAARALVEAEYNWERVATTFERVMQMLEQ